MVLDGISLSVAQGEFVALIGHNGAGKSTLIKLCLGLITPKKGKVKVLDGKPGTSPVSVGYLPENVSFYDGMTIRENLNYFADLKNISRQRADELIESLGLSAVAAQKVGQCSKGQRQRLGLAQALLAKPKLLFLDEPTVGLDPTASDFMYQELLKLKERGCTALEMEIVKAYFELDMDTRQKVFDHFQARLSAAKEQLTAAADAGQQQEAKAPQEMTVAELHAELDRQIAEEKKRAEGLSVSGPGSYEMATG